MAFRFVSLAVFAIALFSTSSGCKKVSITSSQCELNSDCDGELVCFDGRCYEECRNARDCEDDESCVENNEGTGSCQDFARLACDGRCAEGLLCVDGFCRNGCETSPCLDGNQCQTLSGMPVCVATLSCEETSACNDGFQCVSGSCFAECSDEEGCEGSDVCTTDGVCRTTNTSEPFDAGASMGDVDAEVRDAETGDATLSVTMTGLVWTPLDFEWGPAMDGTKVWTATHGCAGDCDNEYAWLRSDIEILGDTFGLVVHASLPGGASPHPAFVFRIAAPLTDDPDDLLTPPYEVIFRQMMAGTIAAQVSVSGVEQELSTNLTPATPYVLTVLVCRTRKDTRALQVKLNMVGSAETTWTTLFGEAANYPTNGGHSVFVGTNGGPTNIGDTFLLQGDIRCFEE